MYYKTKLFVVVSFMFVWNVSFGISVQNLSSFETSCSQTKTVDYYIPNSQSQKVIYPYSSFKNGVLSFVRNWESSVKIWSNSSNSISACSSWVRMSKVVPGNWQYYIFTATTSGCWLNKVKRSNSSLPNWQLVFKVVYKEETWTKNWTSSYYHYKDLLPWSWPKTYIDDQSKRNWSEMKYGDNNCLNIYTHWCGDATLDVSNWEQCDDWNNTNWDGCSSLCTLETPNVSVSALPNEGNIPFNSTINTFWVASWAKYTNLEYWDGSVKTSWISFPNDHSYTSVGSYIVKVQVQNNYEWSIAPWVIRPTASASALVTTNAALVCGDGIINQVWEQCDDWNNISWDWCTFACVIETWWWGWWWGLSVCWNSVIETWEQCDDWNTTNWDGCSNVCATEWWWGWWDWDWWDWDWGWWDWGWWDWDWWEWDWWDWDWDWDWWEWDWWDWGWWDWGWWDWDWWDWDWDWWWSPMCWDGDLQDWEQCDDWNLSNIDSCDNTCNIVPAQIIIYWAPWGYVHWSVSTTASIMSWEYLPIGWKIRNNSDYTSNCSDFSDYWKYRKDTFKIKFKLEWWWGNNFVTTSINWFGTSNLCAFNDTSVDGKTFITDIEDKLTNGENKISAYVDHIEKCTNNGSDYVWQSTGIFINEIASAKFVLTEPYLLQKWATITRTNNTNISFYEHYYDIPWDAKHLSEFIPTTISEYTNYDTWDMEYVLSWFIWKYKDIVVPISSLDYSMRGDKYANHSKNDKIYKLPVKELYYIDMDEYGSNILTINWWNVAKPTTLIVENGDVNITSDIVWSFMLIVKNWSINIKKWDCDKTMRLDWIYITDQKFTAEKIINDDPNTCTWCRDGRMQVNWVMMGKTGIINGSNSISLNRRSLLEWWFDGAIMPDWAIKNWWSLTINANINIWITPPYWAKDLFEKLNIRKTR